jgi:hypothetical protein
MPGYRGCRALMTSVWWGVVIANWKGEKCKALAKHEYKLVLDSEIIVAVNCPLFQPADNIIKKSKEACSVIRNRRGQGRAFSLHISEY